MHFSKPRKRVSDSAAVVLLTTRFNWKTIALFSFPHNRMTQSPALDDPLRKLTEESSVNTSMFKSAIDPKYRKTNLESLLLIFLSIRLHQLNH